MLCAPIFKSWIISRNLPEMKGLMEFPEKEKHKVIIIKKKFSLCRKQSNVTNEESEFWQEIKLREAVKYGPWHF